MMKKLMFIVITFLTFLSISTIIKLPVQGASNVNNVQIVLHHRISEDGNFVEVNNDGKEHYYNDGMVDGVNTTFSVYDLTTKYTDYLTHNRSPENLFQKIGVMSPTKIQKFIIDNKLHKLFNVTTNNAGISTFDVNGSDYKAYLIVQNYGTQSFAMPISISFPFRDTNTGKPMSVIHIYTKATNLRRAPYFFKYGKDSCGNKFPLGGAIFVFYRFADNHRKEYLGINNDWVTSSDPKNDYRILKLSSHKSGLVLLRKYDLTPGTYYFSEVQSAKGFKISNYARHIPVWIPGSLTNLGFSRDIIVNHSRIPPLSAYQVPLSVYYNRDLRIYNCQRRFSSNTITNGKSGGNGSHSKNGGSQPGYVDKGGGNYKTNNANRKGIKGLLPQTGEQQLKFSLLGIALILLGIIIYVFNHRRGEIKNEK
ncbi:pilin N-terminal domain-containing protein [Lactiplantibacillus plantarum]|uniref:pilin N-terminal domain-containing protein n=1 Tax=Lactiplantibacillus plantarum TaxID=1590 RepID=UPI001D08ECEF|nr:pilin N-terminal domain-containing protein [Lactiplantibacillus plantarum]MCB7152006.1 LPXTG cell wall anchor domain-containing protein [Lactiplantibacillus plantarum]MCB7170168.1 LPXTG cell wall anchor domain-containing protein [Lactiplantibacillus plantarum]MCG0659949.1 hypothetical protein [Lactiplantibacillus plantarum]